MKMFILCLVMVFLNVVVEKVGLAYAGQIHYFLGVVTGFISYHWAIEDNK